MLFKCESGMNSMAKLGSSQLEGCRYYLYTGFQDHLHTLNVEHKVYDET